MVGAWVIAQAADLIADNFLAPPWVMQMIITLLIVGLPVSLLLSWAFDLTADGVRRTGAGDHDGSLVVSNKAVLVAVVGLLVILAVVFYVAWPRGDRSIAVLPFEDISPDGDQAYLASGIADELRLELQHLDGLRVAGRTSSNAYAQDGGRAVAEALNVESILEGSVRKEGENIRITVQLTDAADGFTIWSESYNRELADIFAMQEEIATSVAGRLGVSLGVGSVNSFHGAGTQNVEAYEAYLQARVDDFSHSNEQNAIVLLERAIDLDPDYAVAWSMLALQVLSGTYDVSPDELPQVIERARELASEGVRLDPESAGGRSALALVQMNQRNWTGSEQSHLRAIEMLRDRPTLERYAIMLMRSGRMIEAEEQFLTAVSVEPLDGHPHSQIWHPFLAQGRVAEAQEVLDRYQATDLFEDNLDVAFNQSDSEVVKSTILAMPESSVAFVNLYEPLLENFDSPDRILVLLEEVYRDESLRWPRKLHDISMAAAYFGYPQFALTVKGREVRAGVVRMHALWKPVMSDVRRLPEFKELVRELNLVEYWRTYGWADACKPLDEADFSCS